MAMMSSPDQWFKIKGSEDYQFPGVFSAPYPQRLGYCPDITKLGLYTPESPDFLYYDIQFGKDKPRNPQRMTVTLPDTEEALNVIYRFSLVPRPEKGRRKGPGFNCLRMRLIIRNRNTYS